MIVPAGGASALPAGLAGGSREEHRHHRDLSLQQRSLPPGHPCCGVGRARPSLADVFSVRSCETRVAQGHDDAGTSTSTRTPRRERAQATCARAQSCLPLTSHRLEKDSASSRVDTEGTLVAQSSAQGVWNARVTRSARTRPRRTCVARARNAEREPTYLASATGRATKAGFDDLMVVLVVGVHVHVLGAAARLRLGVSRMGSAPSPLRPATPGAFHRRGNRSAGASSPGVGSGRRLRVDGLRHRNDVAGPRHVVPILAALTRVQRAAGPRRAALRACSWPPAASSPIHRGPGASVSSSVRRETSRATS
jgi:hypothetical protein